MRVVFTALISVHALIHAMGFAKAFRLASLTQLKTPSPVRWACSGSRPPC